VWTAAAAEASSTWITATRCKQTVPSDTTVSVCAKCSCVVSTRSHWAPGSWSQQLQSWCRCHYRDAFQSKAFGQCCWDRRLLVLRRDRIGRRGGGVALHVRSSIQSSVCGHTQLTTVHTSSTGYGLVARSSQLCTTLQFRNITRMTCLTTSRHVWRNRYFPAALIVIVGDLNQLYLIRI